MKPDSTTSKVQRRIDYFILLLLIANSGFPFFSGSEFIQIFLFLFTLGLVVKRKVSIDQHFFIVIIIFLVVEILQIAFYGMFNYKTFVGTYVKLSLIYFIVKLLDKNFVSYYVNILYVLSIIGLFFYIFSFIPGFVNFFLSNITPLFKSPFEGKISFYEKAPNIIIYCFDSSLISDFRNSGPFWEPGAFAVFLSIALLFNIISSGTITNKQNIVFIVSILTTISTAGYIALFLIFVGYYTFDKKISSKLLMIIIVLLSVTLFSRLDFLKVKIFEDIATANETTSSRFGSALADYQLFVKSPVIGWGRGDARYGGKTFLKFSQEEHRNNGIFVLLATYGIFISLIYFYLIYKSFYYMVQNWEYGTWFPTISLVIVLILGFSQGIFSLPFFYSFLFLFLNFKKPRTQISF